MNNTSATPSMSDTGVNTNEGLSTGTNALQSLSEATQIVEGNTTNMQSDAATKNVNMPNFNSNMIVEQTLTEQTKHSIESFLGRPFVIISNNLPSSYTDGQSLIGTTLRVPSNTLPPMYLDKMSGFFGFKADFVLRLQVNANRFQQGRLLMYYFPWPITDFNTSFSRFIVNPTLTALTQLPRVELDLSTETEVMLRVPYYSPFPYYPLLDSEPQNYDWAGFNVVVYSSLEDASGSSGVDYTLWGHYENIDLVMPTAPMDTEGFSSRIEAQGLSGILNTVSGVSGALSGVPVIGGFLKPLSWATGILSGTAKAFGFSKPSNEIPALSQHLVTMDRYGNVDGEDQGKKLGLSSTNEVAKLPNFGGLDVDEMSFAHMFSVPAFVRKYNWSVSDPIGTVKYSQRVTPISPGFCNVNVGVPNVIEGPTVSMLPRYFKYWRGGFRIKLKFVKTEFHSGRLAIMFAPATTSTVVPPITNEVGEYLHRDIVDIRTQTEYEFTIPYVSIRPYSKMREDIGMLQINVLNPLRAPSTVPQTIHFLMEVSALPDFEVASPQQYWPYYGSDGELRYANVVGPYSTLPASPIIEAQGGEPDTGQALALDRDIPMDNERTLGTLKSPEDIQTLPAQVCIGERVMSVRQMIRRFEPVSAPPRVGEETPYPSATNNYIYTIRPYNMSFYQGLNLTVDDYNCISRGGALQNFTSTMASCFRFMRGGMRLKISPTNVFSGLASAKLFDFVEDNIIGLMTSPYTQATPTPLTDAWSFFQTTHVNSQYNRTGINGALEIDVPFYSYTPFVPTHFNNNFSLPLLMYGTYKGVDVDTVPDKGEFIVHRATSDDFEFGFFTGFPPMVASLSSFEATASGTANYYIDGSQHLYNPGADSITALDFPARLQPVQVGYT